MAMRQGSEPEVPGGRKHKLWTRLSDEERAMFLGRCNEVGASTPGEGLRMAVAEWVARKKKKKA